MAKKAAADVRRIAPQIPFAFHEFMQPMRYKVAYGGRGSAKSISFAMMLIWIAVVPPLPGCPAELILCAREFQNSIEESVHRTLCDLIQSMGLSQFFVITQHSIKSIYGAEFIFKGLRMNPSAIKSIKGITRCFVEEAQTISAASWEVLIPTVRENNSEFWIVFNPDSVDDPTYQNFVVQQRDDAIVRKVNFDENPFFPDTLRKEMEHCKKFNPARFDNIWMGEPKTISDAIIFGGKFRTEAFETPADVDRFYYGMDFGFNPDPASLIRCFIKDRRLYIDHEAYKTKVELDDLPSFMLGVPGANVWPILADCSQPNTISKLANNGFKISGAKKWDGSIKEGILFLQNFEEIVIHDRCPETAREFRNYSYKVDRQTGQILPDIVDSYNHCIAKGQLIETERGLVAIEEVAVGDMVLTRGGYRKVLFSGRTDVNRKVINVVAGNGSVLKLTPDHLIYTERGFTRADSLRYEDIIYITQREERTCQSAKRWSIKGLCFIATLIQKIGRSGSTSCHAATIGCPVELTAFTGRSGRIILGLYQKVSTFITSTKTLSTMTRRTFAAALQRITRRNTHGMTSARSGNESTSQASGPSPRHGMQARQEKSGIEPMPHRSTSMSPSKNPAKSARDHSSTSHLEAGESFAATSANRKLAGIQEWMTSKFSAHSVPKSSNAADSNRPRVVPSRVVCVLDGGEIVDEVFDLTVEGEHEFFANGVLVHNCIDAIRYALQPLISNKGQVRTAQITGF